MFITLSDEDELELKVMAANADLSVMEVPDEEISSSNFFQKMLHEPELDASASLLRPSSMILLAQIIGQAPIANL